MHDDLISRQALIAEIMRRGIYPPGVRHAIENAPAIDAVPVVHGKWIKFYTHMWARDTNGEIDEWAFDAGIHNGPSCLVCGYNTCVHCNPNWKTNTCSIGHYQCSECKHESEEGSENYCPNCGAKMDKEADND